MYNISFNLSFTAAFVMGITVLILNRWFIGIWVGADLYLGDTFNTLLCINFILQAAVLPNRIALATTFYKIEWHNITRVTEGIMKLVVTIFLFQFIGINAVAVGSIIACVLFSSLSLNYLTSRLVNENFWKKIRILLLTPMILLIFYLTDEGLIRILTYLLLLGLIAIIFIIKEKQNLKTVLSRLPGFNSFNGKKMTEMEELS
jgi:O-antigen/teichoic acid export membrane protein